MSFKPVQSIKAVSYTHLDVYKRQPFFLPFKVTLAVFFVRLFFVTVAIFLFFTLTLILSVVFLAFDFEVTVNFKVIFLPFFTVTFVFFAFTFVQGFFAVFVLAGVALGFTVGVAPVSYTHLDVYKRQL